MESAFGIEHGEFSKAGAFGHAMGAGFKAIHPKNIKSTWNAMGTGEKVATVGGSGLIGLGVGLNEKKKTGRFTGNGGLVGVAARHTKMGYVKRSLTPGQPS